MPSGRTIPLSLTRRLVCDLVHFAQKVPTVPVQRIINIGKLDAVRSQMRRRPSWCVLFTKAYAVVSAEMPELRRAYLSFPWARLYEHGCNIASVAVERYYQGEPGVFFAHIHDPQTRGLLDIEDLLQRYKDDPIEQISEFRTSMMMTRLPKPLRRLGWWYLMNVRGYRKANWIGTFGVSVYSSLGAESLHPLSPLTTALNYGVIAENGDVTVRVVYDHRVMDGTTIARALARLEQVLNQQILAELSDLADEQVPGLFARTTGIKESVS